jgi:RNA polymerase sigma factor (sigma-70 family)
MTAGRPFSATVDAAREGDEGAWTTLYRQFSPMLLGYLRARRAAEPEDLLGEVFAQAVRDLRSFEGSERDFRAWMFSIAHNRLVDEARRRARRPVVPAPEETIAAHGESGDVESEALARFETAEVIRLIGLLSADQQSVLLLRILGGLTVPEIARVIGKRRGAVKQLQRRGLIRLRRELDR